MWVSAPLQENLFTRLPTPELYWHTPVLIVVRKWHQHNFKSREGGKTVPSYGASGPDRPAEQSGRHMS